jgi:hypothetical protein
MIVPSSPKSLRVVKKLNLCTEKLQAVQLYLPIVLPISLEEKRVVCFYPCPQLCYFC